MTSEQIRVLLDERFGPLREVARERLPLTPGRLIARRRRVLAEIPHPLAEERDLVAAIRRYQEGS